MTQEYTKPLPRIDDENRPFWQGCKEHRLLVQRCSACGRWRWPPAEICPGCLSWDYSWEELGGAGSVVTFVVAHRAFQPSFEPDVPYVIADVALEGTDGHVVFVTNIIGCPWDRVHVGMPVTVDFDDVTPEVSLPKFRPLELPSDGTGG